MLYIYVVYLQRFVASPAFGRLAGRTCLGGQTEHSDFDEGVTGWHDESRFGLPQRRRAWYCRKNEFYDELMGS
uniref:Secreted protein n=1 Tax=Heterorhabditis bacteriophora TaxID=37862 RepID=A0A1I7W9V2_HETBA